jgi:hypothetical protein
VTTTLDQSAADESFAIVDVRLVAFANSLGKSGGPLANTDGTAVDLSTDEGVAPFGGLGLSRLSCQSGVDTALAVAADKVGAEAFVSARFTELPEHNVATIALDVLPLHDKGDLTIEVSLAGKKIFTTTLGAPGQGAGVCPTGKPVKYAIQHAESTLSLDVTATVAAGASVAKFVVRNVAITLETLGNAAWTAGVLDTFEVDTAGWLGAGDMQRTDCGSDGWILGGSRTLPKGSISKKTFTGIPAHTALVIRFNFFYLTWTPAEKKAFLEIDGVVTWSESVADFEAEASSSCGYSTVKRSVDVYLSAHQSAEVALAFYTEVDYNGERFGIQNVQLLPFQLQGGGQGPWSENTLVFTTTQNFQGSGLRTDQCGSARRLRWTTSATNPLGIAARKFIGITPEQHDLLRVRFSAYHVAVAGVKQTLKVAVDDGIIYENTVTSAVDASLASNCDANVLNVDLFLAHTGSSATVRFWIVVDDAEANTGAAAIADLTLTPLTNGRAAYRSEGEASDFTAWSDSWGGTSRARTTCNTLGTILGGALGTGAYLEKVYTDLPQHSALRIELKFVFLRTWDYEHGIIYVDGEEEWRQRYWHRDGAADEDCGQLTHYTDVEIILLDHTSETVTLRVTTNLDQEASDEGWGIVDVIITPFDNSLGGGTGPFAAGLVDFTKEADRRPWSGAKGASAGACPSEGANGYLQTTSLVAPQGRRASTTFVSAQYTDLPSHNALRILATVAFMHAKGSQEARLVVDTATIWSMSSDSEEDVDPCNPPALQRGTVSALTQHSGSTVDLVLAASSLASQAFFTISGFEVRPITLGVDAFSGDAANDIDQSDFSQDTDGWFAAGNQQRSTCENAGAVLGGLDTGASGSRSFKKYTGLPEHRGLVVQATLFGIGVQFAAAEAQLYVDAQLTFQQRLDGLPASARSKDCGGSPTDRIEVFAYVQDHTSDSAEIAFTITAEQFTGSPFALYDVRVQPLQECDVGRFESSPPTASQPRVCAVVQTCEAGTYEKAAPTKTTDRLCVTCSQCGAGFEEDQRCSATTDTSCVRCQGCGAGQYQSAPCQDGKKAVCKACATCTPSQYVAVACGLDFDTVCRDCTPQCAADEYEARPCSQETDRICAKLTVCDGVYQPAPPDPSSDRTCPTKIKCDDNEYVFMAATATSNLQCKSYTPPCDPAIEYESQTPDASTDRRCSEISSCVVGSTYETAAATATADRLCAVCTQCEGPVTSACTLTEDATCQACAICQADQYLLQECSRAQTSICINCRECGQNQFEAEPCRQELSGDRRCQACRTECDAVEQYIATACTKTADAQCEDVSECKPNEFESQKPVPRREDRVCTTCQVCKDTEYISVPCSATSDTVCVGCSACGASEYPASACQADVDTGCRACKQCASGLAYETGACNADGKDRECTSCMVCTDEQYEVTPCTVTSNRKCVDLTLCQGDTYAEITATKTSDRKCSARTKCVTDEGTEYIADDGSPSLDRQCAPVSECQSGVTHQAAPPTATSDRDCRTVTTCKKDGRGVPVEYETRAPTKLVDRECTAVTQCELGATYEDLPPTATADRTCQPTTACANGNYESISATSTSDRTCAVWKVCRPSWTELSMPSAAVDRVCEGLLRMVFRGDFAALLPTPAAETSFVGLLSAKIRSLVGAQPDRIVLSPGSIVADVYFQEEVNYDDAALALSSGQIVLPVQGVGAQPQELRALTEAQASSSNVSSNVPIIAGVVAATAVVVLLAVGVVVYRRRLKRQGRSGGAELQGAAISKGAGRSSIAFKNPMYNEASNADAALAEAYQGDEGEGAYDTLPISQGEDDTGAYMDVGGVGNEGGGYMTIRAGEGGEEGDGGYMSVRPGADSNHGEGDDTYMEVRRADAEEPAYMTTSDLQDGEDDAEDTGYMDM